MKNLQEKEVQAWLSEIIAHYEKKNNILISEIKQLAADLFAVRCQTMSSGTKLTEKSGLYFLPSIPNALLINFDSLKYQVLPRILAHRLLLKSCYEEIDALISMNCARLRYDLSNRAADSVTTFKRELDAYLDETVGDILGTIEAGIKQKEQGEQGVQKKAR